MKNEESPMNVLKALQEGKKLTNNRLKKGEYIFLKENYKVMFMHPLRGVEPNCNVIGQNEEWYVYEPEHKELTVKEIEAKLGYKIKVVGVINVLV